MVTAFVSQIPIRVIPAFYPMAFLHPRERGRCGQTLEFSKAVIFKAGDAVSLVANRVILLRGFAVSDCVQPDRRGELRAW